MKKYKIDSSGGICAGTITAKELKRAKRKAQRKLRKQINKGRNHKQEAEARLIIISSLVIIIVLILIWAF